MLKLTHMKHPNDITCQYSCPICMSTYLNMHATAILATYTLYYTILHYILYPTLHISCIWYHTYAYTPKSFHPIVDTFHMTGIG